MWGIWEVRGGKGELGKEVRVVEEGWGIECGWLLLKERNRVILGED